MDIPSHAATPSWHLPPLFQSSFTVTGLIILMTHLMRDFQDYVSQALGAINRRRVFHEAEPMVHPALADITYPSAPPPTPSNGPDDPFQGWDGWHGPRGPIENGPATVPSSTAVEYSPTVWLSRPSQLTRSPRSCPHVEHHSQIDAEIGAPTCRLCVLANA